MHIQLLWWRQLWSAWNLYPLACCCIDCNQLGLCINEYIFELITISLDCILIGILLNWLQSAWIVYRWAYCWIDCNQLGLYINGHWQWFWWWVWWWIAWLIPLGRAGLSTTAKHSTAQTRGFYGYQPRGFNWLAVKQTSCISGYYNSEVSFIERIEPFVKVICVKKGRRFWSSKT